MSSRPDRHPSAAIPAYRASMIPAPLLLLSLFALCACTTFDAGPPPPPAAAVEPGPVVPTGIRPLTADQRDMLDG